MNKLKIQRSYIYLLLVLFIGFAACSDSDKDDIKVEPDMNLVGKVLADGQPMEGVVVSDGYKVATTDNSGVYQIQLRKESKFVFVSVPENCEIPHKNNIPLIYQRLGIRLADEVLRRDFNLKKTEVKDNFYLMALADVQIANSTDLTLLKDDIVEIKSHVSSLTDMPVYGVSLGDLVWDNMTIYGDYTEQISRIGVPTFQVIGNHDHDMNIINNDAASAKIFEQNFGPTYYSYNIGKAHFVVLDDVYYTGGSGKDYKGHITQNQLDWLKEDLKYVSKDKLIVLSVHIATQRRNKTTAVDNRKDLYDLLEGYNVRILSGHSHNNYTTTIAENIEENTIGAVSGAFWTGDMCNDGAPRGFAIYEIKGNEITNWYYKGTYHDKNYQMKIFPPNSNGISNARKNYIITNLFSWHTNWTVDIKEDNGTETIFTENVKEMDPDAYDYMYGPNKPAIRQSITNPETDNDHMLYYKPSDDWKSVTVTAKDPYGNVYQESLTNGAK